MVKEVHDLGREVDYLMQSLERSRKVVQVLWRRLKYYESKEGEELVHDSIAYQRDTDSARMMITYSTYVPCNFGGSQSF